ncbi:MAG: endonuclease [Lachnospiraceae bacterium]|nr:endonuclease [Lachnospiraceae bacterium]
MKKFLRIVLVILILLVVGLGAGVIYLTVKEYNPEATETVPSYGNATKEIAEGDTISVMTYNIGYGANDATRDFFMDGGQDVLAESEDKVNENMEGIIANIYGANADIHFIQEVDVQSKRSYFVDEANKLANTFSDYRYSFANNYVCDYVPYPLVENTGKVDAGIMTIAPYDTESVERISLSNSYNWPVRVVQLKRCLLVERIPVKDSNKKLVAINVHLEAYGDNDDKLTQFKELCNVMQLEYAQGNYVIVGGDFNAILPSVDTSKYPLKITDNFEPAIIPNNLLATGWKFATDDTTPTSRLLNQLYDANDTENTQYYVLDGFICSSNVLIDSVKTLNTEFNYSDHNPVVAKFVLTKV